MCVSVCGAEDASSHDVLAVAAAVAAVAVRVAVLLRLRAAERRLPGGVGGGARGAAGVLPPAHGEAGAVRGPGQVQAAHRHHREPAEAAPWGRGAPHQGLVLLPDF